MTDPIQIERRLLQIAFDCAVNSMDFSSGFFDDEEVTALREIAALLGVDPMSATPETFRCKYTGQHVPHPHRPEVCIRCRQTIPGGVDR